MKEGSVAVDVRTETDIQRPRAEVAAYATDPTNTTSWCKNISRVEWKMPPPPAAGSQVAFVSRFLCRPLAYTYEITDHTPGAPRKENCPGPLPDGDDVRPGRYGGRRHEDDPSQPRQARRLLEDLRALHGHGGPPRQHQGPQTSQGDPRGERSLTAPLLGPKAAGRASAPGESERLGTPRARSSLGRPTRPPRPAPSGRTPTPAWRSGLSGRALSRTGARARIEPQIGDQLPRAAEPADVADRGQKRRRADHVHPGHGHQPACLRRAQRLAGDQPLDRSDLPIEELDVAQRRLDRLRL